MLLDNQPSLFKMLALSRIAREGRCALYFYQSQLLARDNTFGFASISFSSRAYVTTALV